MYEIGHAAPQINFDKRFFSSHMNAKSQFQINRLISVPRILFRTATYENARQAFLLKCGLKNV